MTAIITTPLKKILIESLVTDIEDSANRYYIGIGKADDWDSSDTPPTPLNTLREERNTRYAMQSVKNVTDISFVVPRTTWSSGALYSAYSDNVVGQPVQNYYVITDENQVYICLRQSKDAAGNAIVSTIKPTGFATTDFQTADGYVWKFLYSISSPDASKFLAANYMPVRYVPTTTSESSATDVEQETVQNAAVPQGIVGYRLTSGGTGYSSAPSVSIVGDGTGAKATATVSGGVVTKVEVKDSAGEIVTGTGYSNALVTMSGGGGVGATVFPILSPYAGVGADPRIDLRSSAIMLNTKPDGSEAGEFTIGNDFRQVSIIRNPKDMVGAAYTATAGNALRAMTFNTISVPFTADKLIEGVTTKARAYVDKVDGLQVYYHQTEATGFGVFEEQEVIDEVDGSGTGVLDNAAIDTDNNAFDSAAVNFLSGDLLYIDNRAAIARSAEQQEDIKIIIQI